MQQQSQPSAESAYQLHHLLLEKVVQACGACPVCFHLFVAKVHQVLLQVGCAHKHMSSISHRHLQQHYCHEKVWVYLYNNQVFWCKPILADDRAGVMIEQETVQQTRLAASSSVLSINFFFLKTC